MALPKSTIYGRFPIPDDSILPGAYVLFQISGFDTDGDDVVIPAPVRVDLDDDGEATFDLWKNTEGLRGTYYKVTLRYTTDDGTPGSSRGVQVVLPNIQVAGAASYDVADLFNTPVPDAPEWNVNLNPALYAELLADISDIQTTRDQMIVFVSQSATSVTLAVGDAVIVSETASPYPSIRLEIFN